MSSEFDYLIQEGHKVTKEVNNEAEFISSVDPVDLDAEAKKTATNLLIGLDAGIHYFWPFVQVPDQVYENGVQKITPVARKYGGGELPSWMIFLKQYQDEFLAGVWCAGFAMEVKRQIKVEAERVAAEKAKQEGQETDINSGETVNA